MVLGNVAIWEAMNAVRGRNCLPSLPQLPYIAKAQNDQQGQSGFPHRQHNEGIGVVLEELTHTSLDPNAIPTKKLRFKDGLCLLLAVRAIKIVPSFDLDAFLMLAAIASIAFWI
jgi:hypothetical protein